MPAPFDLLPILLKGLPATLAVTVGGIAVALVSALLAGLGRSSRDPIVRWTSIFYIETFRGVSAIVLLYWFFFALPLLTGLRLPAILAGIVVLGLNIGAYGAEVVRAAIESVPPGQRQAAKALNLSAWQTMRYVVLPQAALAATPPLGNLMIELLKSTALVSMITVVDLTQMGMFLRTETHRSLAIFSMLLLIYFVLSQCIALTVRLVEWRLSHGQDYGGTR
ncbi:ectoine/hydroxyectoine ABC transporter permease subunit EhuC [Blastopirellula retiformator]|uniref:Inner membrane amino-acid ABC transporter permease protein YecS n=1 Tax=Blastopirellula retiformator TaxID=2527970 RepID=A0A5C5V8I1_9BACT|nr:ectoine/hydroxyectoine ABC transporter permease subunit EhuC [Blastopirellula retiformator]TWT34886.1 Inner membrane amino-acid ABC transporter permease protein YecS [Blastopirellula retiformator]